MNKNFKQNGNVMNKSPTLYATTYSKQSFDPAKKMNCQTFCSTLLSFYYNKDQSSSSGTPTIVIDAEEWVIRAMMHHLESRESHTFECDHYTNYLLDAIVRKKLGPDSYTERMLASKNIQEQIDQLNKKTDELLYNHVVSIIHNKKKTKGYNNPNSSVVSLKRARSTLPLQHQQQEQRKKRQRCCVVAVV